MMLQKRYDPQNIKGFTIEDIKPPCVACRHELRLSPGKPGPDDEIIFEGGYAFFVNKEIMNLAKCITIDAAGDIPVLFAKESLDPRENY